VYADTLCSDNNCEQGITDKNKFCYKATVYETTKLLAKKLNLDSSKYEVTFQSRLTNKWLNPFSDKVLEDLACTNHKKVLVFSPAFTADCLETIFEIGDEYKELFIKAGGEVLDYVPSLNYSDMWVESLINIADLGENNV
jgi:ferrochelatase